MLRIHWILVVATRLPLDFPTQTWDPGVFCIEFNTSQGSSKYFPDRPEILPRLPNNTSQNMWIAINTEYIGILQTVFSYRGVFESNGVKHPKI